MFSTTSCVFNRITVVSPDVLFAQTHFARAESPFAWSIVVSLGLSVHTYNLRLWAFFRTRNIHTPFSPVYLCQMQHYIDQKNIKLDLILFILRYIRKRLIIRAK